MSLRIRRGLEAQRSTIMFDQGEIVWTTDNKQLYIGDGTTLGGIHVNRYATGAGLTFNTESQKIELDTSGLYSINVDQFIEMTPRPSAPSSPQEGMIVIANRVNWDPANKGSGRSYPVYYDGVAWNAFY